MAERAFVFGVREKWKYSPLKVKKTETDFTAVLAFLQELCMHSLTPEGRFASHGDEKELTK